MGLATLPNWFSRHARCNSLHIGGYLAGSSREPAIRSRLSHANPGVGGRRNDRPFMPVACEVHPAHDPAMRVIVTSNDLIRLSFLTALLSDAGIDAVLLDSHTSILEGSAGAIPRRLVVSEEDFAQARRVLRDAGEW
jgi:hypothetical protein